VSCDAVCASASAASSENAPATTPNIANFPMRMMTQAPTNYFPYGLRLQRQRQPAKNALLPAKAGSNATAKVL
jgi:hypothetical protein